MGFEAVQADIRDCEQCGTSFVPRREHARVCRGELAVWLREHLTLGPRQYLCLYDSLTWRCSAYSAGFPCLPGPTAPRTPRSLSCATRSPVPGRNIQVLRRDRLGGLIHEYAQLA
jgi:hypothetical protein